MMKKNKSIITIDGPSYVGKSTIAKELSNLLDFTYINTGHMYRSVAKFGIENNISNKDAGSIVEIAENLNIEFKYFKKNTRTFVNNVDLTESLHYPEIVSYSSKIAQIPQLRKKLNQMQYDYAKKGNVIFEGRDLGTVVFPDAKWKFYITASLKVRAMRMKKNLIKRDSSKKINYIELIPKVSDLDERDTKRKIAPLKKADDAIVYDNSDSPTEKQDAIVLQYYINNTDEIIANNSILLNK